MKPFFDEERKCPNDECDEVVNGDDNFCRRCGTDLTNFTNQIIETPSIASTEENAGDSESEDALSVLERVTTRDGDHIHKLLEAISSASDKVWLKVPWFTDPESEETSGFVKALSDCVDRHLDVRVILRPEASNSTMIQTLNSKEIEHRTVRYLHEKELLIDDRLLSFSANFTPTDLTRNDNVYYEISSPVDINSAQVDFKIKWDALASEISAGEERFSSPEAIVPSEFLDFFQRELNPLQSKALPVVFGSNASMIVSAPTGAGKTDVGLAGILKAIKQEKLKAAWLIPSVALSRELNDTFRSLRTSGIRVERLAGDEDLDNSSIDRADLWVSTYEKFESVFRRESLSASVAQLGCVIVDEVHSLGDEQRGPTLEALLARLKLLSQRTRLIGLSATVSNNEELADWLNAELLQVAWRPVQLTTQLIGYPDRGRWLDNEIEKDLATRGLINEIRREKGSTLVFCGSKNKVRRTAGSISAVAETEEDSFVQNLAQQKVGIHYRGVPRERDTLASFRAREIEVLVATSTLAQGVNLPARAVFIRDTTLGLDSEISVGDVQQMAGRAGRVGLENEGFAFFLVPEHKLAFWRNRLCEGYFVKSHLASSVADHVLAEIHRKSIQSVDTLRKWFAGTFAAYQGELTQEESNEVLDSALELLITSRMVTEDPETGLLVSTEIGSLTSKFLIKCEDAASILNSLPGPDPLDATDAELKLLNVFARNVEDLKEGYCSSVNEIIDYLPEAITSLMGDLNLHHSDENHGILKTLLAAHIHLNDQMRLANSRNVCEVSISEIRQIGENLSRHLAWLGALGKFTSFGWTSAVSADLAQRIKWAKAFPTRGSGRLLSFIESTVSREEHARVVPREFNRNRTNPDSINNFTRSPQGRITSAINFEVNVENTPANLQAAIRGVPQSALPLNLVITARSAAVPVIVADKQWTGDTKSIPYPEGVLSTEKVAVEFLAYGEDDWGYEYVTNDVDTEIISQSTNTQLQDLIERLPDETILRRRRRLLRNRDFKERVTAILSTTSEEFSEISYIIAGQGSDHNQKISRIIRFLRSNIQIESERTEVETVAQTLKTATGSASSWAILFTVMAKHVGLESGLVRDNNMSLLALVKDSENNWKIVCGSEYIEISESQFHPFIPNRDLGATQTFVLEAETESSYFHGPVWSFLRYFRFPQPPDPSGPDPTPDPIGADPTPDPSGPDQIPDPGIITHQRESETTKSSRSKNSVPHSSRKKLRTELIEFAKSRRNDDSEPPWFTLEIKTIDAIVDRAPKNEEELRSVPGIGKFKVRKFGNEILELVNEHLYEKLNEQKSPKNTLKTKDDVLNMWPLPENLSNHNENFPLREKPRAGISWVEIEDRYLELLYKEGVSIRVIAEVLERTEGSIRSRLKRKELIIDS